ncbi:MAG: molybdate ABC transporter permease subunit, partial [Nocardiopsis sp. BM-2018]
MTTAAPSRSGNAGGAPTPRTRASRAKTGRIPWILVLPAVIGVLFLVLPFAGMLIRAPWTTMG